MTKDLQSATAPIGLGVIGLGFMGQTHIGACRGGGDACRLAGVFDLDSARLTGEIESAGNIDTRADGVERLFDPAALFATDRLDELLSRDEIQAVCICTPTDTHVEIARSAIRAGKHVLIEKPVSLSRADVDDLAEEAERAGVVAMPAMCMRFWPAWAWLKDTVNSGDAVESLALERVGTAPGWGGGFYQDDERSGGALYDLHIHDTDFVCHLLGLPTAVTSTGTRSHVTTVYHYESGPAHVVARGGWLRGGAGFRMRYLAELASGTADFDLLRDPSLMKSDAARHEEPAPVRVGEESGYDGELRAFVDSIARGTPPPVSLADASATLAVLEAEARSLETRTRITLQPA